MSDPAYIVPIIAGNETSPVKQVPPYASLPCDLRWPISEESGYFRAVGDLDRDPALDSIDYTAAGGTVVYVSGGLVPSDPDRSAFVEGGAQVVLTRPSTTPVLKSRAIEFSFSSPDDPEDITDPVHLFTGAWSLTLNGDTAGGGLDEHQLYGTASINDFGVHYYTYQWAIANDVRDKLFSPGSHHVVQQGIQQSWTDDDGDPHHDIYMALTIDNQWLMIEQIEGLSNSFSSGTSAYFGDDGIGIGIDDVRLYATIGDGDGFLEPGLGLSHAKVNSRYRSWRLGTSS